VSTPGGYHPQQHSPKLPICGLLATPLPYPSQFIDGSGENKTLIPKKAMSEIYSLLQNSEAEFIECAKDSAANWTTIHLYRRYR
jgi:hypothetical protein